MATAVIERFSIEEFLELERNKDLLRFSTAGSVDDGKSTLIGRLLYDTQSVYEDQVRSIEGKGTTAPGQIDFALLTDGLRAEREQGITIDVAYRYFSTAKRKFIIADTPGHEQYTRNMATGASTADATVVLIDASKGVLVQSRRHAYIASLLRVRHAIVAVNKMDLIGYDEGAFRAIEKDFRAVLATIAENTGTAVEAVFVPVSALAGDNVVHRTDAMPWYEGPSLLEVLESLPSSRATQDEAFRFPVQRVVRPNHTFRGFAGQIASGVIRVGDAITVQPSGRSAKVQRIVTWDGDLKEAHAPLSVTLVLDSEVDISRGDLITAAGPSAQVSRDVTASVVWMDARPLEIGRKYLIKHTSHTAPAVVSSLEHRTNVALLERELATTLEMNDIGSVRLRLLRPMALDSYAENRATGAFILIDPQTNGTVAAGMVTGIAATEQADDAPDAWGQVTAGEREARWGHRGGVLELSGPATLINAIERSLFTIGVVSARVGLDDDLRQPALLGTLIDVQTRSGILTLLIRENEGDELTARVETESVSLDANEPMHAISAVHQLLNRAGIFVSAEGANL
ncbi:sulfate adenylyltransferase subunit CysN [Occallatibacter riparius]|uniref:Sulfate adenylyltransferase subunit 1 n=1 Tax=Occallatibacter riparius TaxID=1002689 RepID=A0A9J7BHQ6_9BACT|nr:sulfate adenylyltransferase subunit CysN [Occallatibacter riparius]UWZ82484.1 sulfate adenylyltransferase subunit CysN [Occallatibacter riparius]